MTDAALEVVKRNFESHPSGPLLQNTRGGVSGPKSRRATTAVRSRISVVWPAPADPKASVKFVTGS